VASVLITDVARWIAESALERDQNVCPVLADVINLYATCVDYTLPACVHIIINNQYSVCALFATRQTIVDFGALCRLYATSSVVRFFFWYPFV
jgi:hypothetical protein